MARPGAGVPLLVAAQPAAGVLLLVAARPGAEARLGLEAPLRAGAPWVEERAPMAWADRRQRGRPGPGRTPRATIAGPTPRTSPRVVVTDSRCRPMLDTYS